MRWLDCHGRYMRDFDPDCWGWRTDFSRGHEVVGRFYGVVTIRLRQVIEPAVRPQVAGNPRAGQPGQPD